MAEIKLELDNKAMENIKMLMNHYNMKSPQELIKKGLKYLKLAAMINVTDGQLVLRKDDNETRMHLR